MNPNASVVYQKKLYFFDIVRLLPLILLLLRWIAVVGFNDPDVDNTPGPESDTIFVQGLGQDITKEKIAEYFGQIGVIKVT